MSKRLFRGAAIAVCLAAAASIAGCGGDDANPAVFSGSWSGSLTLTYAGGGGSGGGVALSLGQDEDFVAGWADWDPIRERQSVTGPIDGTSIELWLHFRCLDAEFDVPRTQVAVITGSLDGNTLTFSGASGLACPGGGVPIEVTGGSGQVVRFSDAQPL